MKKLFGVVAIAACLSFVGIDEAKAGGPFCVTYAGFCDQVTIRTEAAAGRTWIVGNWDYTCAGPGVNDTQVSGVNDGFTFGGSADDFAVQCQHKIHAGASLLDFICTFDGVAVGFFIDNNGASVAGGACPGHPANPAPRLLDR